MFRFRTFVLCCACLAHVCAAAGADELTLSASKDNTLILSLTGSLSNGSGPNFFVGLNNAGEPRRGVLAFDVSGRVPAGAMIENATLRLHMSRSQVGDRLVSLHGIAADWGEGGSATSGGSGAASMTGDATWVHRFYDSALWDTPGGDFVPEVSAVATVGGGWVLRLAFDRQNGSRCAIVGG